MKRGHWRQRRRRVPFAADIPLRSDRERAQARIPMWLATLLGPYVDEVGWKHVIGRWATFGGAAAVFALAFTCDTSLLPVIGYAVVAVLFLIAVLTT